MNHLDSIELIEYHEKKHNCLKQIKNLCILNGQNFKNCLYVICKNTESQKFK